VSERRKQILIATGAGAFALLLSWAVAGTYGLVGVCAVAFVGALIVSRSRLLPSRPMPARRRRDVPFVNSDFPAYRRIQDALFWSPISQRHFDHGMRPLLMRVTATRLASRAGIDLYRDPTRARAVIGEEYWPLVDPRVPPSQDSNVGGVPLNVLRNLLDRLESL